MCCQSKHRRANRVNHARGYGYLGVTTPQTPAVADISNIIRQIIAPASQNLVSTEKMEQTTGITNLPAQPRHPMDDKKGNSRSLERSVPQDSPPSYEAQFQDSPIQEFTANGNAYSPQHPEASYPPRLRVIERDITNLTQAISAYNLGTCGAKSEAKRDIKQLIRDLYTMHKAQLGPRWTKADKKVIKAQLKGLKCELKTAMHRI